MSTASLSRTQKQSARNVGRPAPLKTRQAGRMKQSWQRLGFVSTHRQVRPVSIPFRLSFQCHRDFSTTFPAHSSETQDLPPRWHPRSDQLTIKQIRLSAEKEKRAEERIGPSRSPPRHRKIYEKYLEAVNNAGDNPLPLEIHQATLRACSPSSDYVRAMTARLLQRGRVSWGELTHPHKSRFEKIMQNIVDAGFKPTIHDFHLVMIRLAAVGQYAEIQKYMQQMGGAGLEPNKHTYGFLLQALAHLVSLSASSPDRPSLLRELVGILFQTFREMIDRGIPPSPPNLDLTFRVLSEVQDLQGLAELLRFGYGVDLNYLDSPPMDSASAPSISTAGLSPTVLPFSTDALNSLLHVLGRWGQISKALYAFETLTNPLRVPAKPDNVFDDDEDDFLPIQQAWKPHSVEPNTTSFNILIRYCTAYRYHWLARHYANQLMMQERKTTLRLQLELRRKSLCEVAAPRLAVNEKTFRPIRALAGRSHKIELMRWVVRASKLSIRRKYRSWLFYQQERWRYEPELASSASDTPTPPESPSSSIYPIPPSANPPHPHPLDISLHLRILKQDIATLSQENWRARGKLFRLIASHKAQLGRRVWRGKDVYLRDRGMRVKVDREMWKQIVNFQEDKRAAVKEQPRGRWKVYPRNVELSAQLPES